MRRVTGDTQRVVGLAGLLATAGVVHFVRPRMFEPLIPRCLRRAATPRWWVLASGAAELTCAAAVAAPPTRRAGAVASGALFVAVFPGNVTMALDYCRAGKPWWQQTIAVCRLPLQWPLIRIALRVREQTPTRASPSARPEQHLPGPV